VAELPFNASTYRLVAKADIVEEAFDIYSSGRYAPGKYQGVTIVSDDTLVQDPGLAKPTAPLPEFELIYWPKPAVTSCGVIPGPEGIFASLNTVDD